MPELAFDSTQYEDMKSYKTIPKGDYPMEIVASPKKKNDKGNSYLNVEIVVIAGPHKGARVWTILNLWNSNPDAVAISQRELATICRALGVLKPQNSEELHKIPFIGSVIVKPAKGNNPERNEMTGYAPYDPNKVSTASPAASASAPPAAKTSSVPDWMKKKEEKPIAPAEKEAFDGPPAEDEIPV